ncbi:hypothetical protein GCM10020370_57370 [Paenibacillus hodogayensis]
MSELRTRLERLEGIRYRFGSQNFTYDVETVKAVLEDLCGEAGVHIRQHTKVVDAVANDGRITAIVTESHSGREAFAADYLSMRRGTGTWRHGSDAASRGAIRIRARFVTKSE